MWWLLGVLALLGTASAAVDVDSDLAKMYCFKVDGEWTAKMNNTGLAGNFSDIARDLFQYGPDDPINGGYCILADIGLRKARYLFDCEHPMSNITVRFDGKDTVRMSGSVVRCNTQWNGKICQQQIDNGNICKIDFQYHVGADKAMNRLIGQVKDQQGGGKITCGIGLNEATTYIGSPQERFLTLSGQLLQKGDHGTGWLFQTNSIDPSVYDRRGDLSFSMVCPPDVDECEKKTHNCDTNARCTNTLGSFTCACNANFHGDGVKCTPDTTTVSGHVFDDANRDNKPMGDNGFPNVTVNVVGTNGKIVNTTVTDALGGYIFHLVPGKYTIQVVVPNGKVISYAPKGAEGAEVGVQVQIDTTYTGIDFGLRDNIQFITGQVKEDINCDGTPKGDPGFTNIVVTLVSSNGAVVTQTVTDCSGRFQLQAAPGDYFVVITIPSGKVISYDVGGTGDGVAVVNLKPNENVNNILFGLCDAKQSISGIVRYDANRDGKPAGDKGYPGVNLRLVDDETGNVVAMVITDGEGKFVIETAPGKYKIQIVLPEGLVLSYSPTGTKGTSTPLTVIAGKNYNNVTFGLRDALQTVSGSVLNDENRDGKPEGDTGVSGIAVYLKDGNNRIVSQTVTDSEGKYLLEGRPGKYTICITLPTGKVISYDTSGKRDGTAPITIKENVNVENIIFGIRQNLQKVSGKVLEDVNRDGKPDKDPGIADIIINVLDLSSVIVEVMITDKKGTFSKEIPPGSYTLQVVVPGGKAISYAPEGSSGNSAPLAVMPGTDVSGIIFGLYEVVQTVSGRVQDDANRDGRPDGDDGVPGIPVQLLDLSNKTVVSTKTDAQGNFKMDTVPGAFMVKIAVPDGKLVSYDISGTRDGTAPISVVQGTNYNGVIFGLRDATQVISGVVQEDANRDGLGEGDCGYRGITVKLLDSAGNQQRSVETDVNGLFSFEAVPSTYTVKIVVPPKEVVSYAPDGTRSDSLTVKLPVGGNVDCLLWGLRLNTQKVSGHVLSDGNRDGKPEDDPGLAGVTVRVIDSIGSVVGQGTSGADGLFEIMVPPGSYTIRSDIPAGKAVSYNSVGTTEAWASLEVKENNDVSGFVFGFKDEALGVLSGKVLLDDDMDGTPAGDTRPVPGCLVTVLNDAGQEVGKAKTRAQGEFRFENLPPGTYKVQVTSLKGYEHSYDCDDTPDGVCEVEISNTDPQSLLFGLKVSTGCIQGYVLRDVNKDGLAAGDPGFTPSQTVLLLDSKGKEIMRTTTEPDGFFDFIVVPKGNVTVKLVIPTGFAVSYQTGTAKDGVVHLDILPAKTLPVSFGLKESSCEIHGMVFEEVADANLMMMRSAVGNVVVRLLDEQGIALLTERTANDGTYSFPTIAPATYTVKIEVPSGFEVSVDPDGLLDGQTKLTLPSGQTMELNFGIKEAKCEVKGTIVYAKEPSQHLGNNPPAPNIRVELMDPAGNILTLTTTDSLGVYSFEGMKCGAYRVHVVTPPNLEISFAPDGTTSNSVSVTTIHAQDMSFDFGVRACGADVTGKVSIDNNRDGKSSGDPGAPGVLVVLIDERGNAICTTLTLSDGTFAFEKISPGKYIVEVLSPPGKEISYHPPGAENGKAPVTVTTGKNVYLVFGYRDIGTMIAGLVNMDTNNDGRPESDPPLSGVTINLLDSAGKVIKSVVTNISGRFTFFDIVAGKYSVQVVPPKDNAIAYQPPGAVDGVYTATVIAGQPILGLVFGMMPNGSCIEGKVRYDTNRDFVPVGDPAAFNITVFVYDGAGNVAHKLLTNNAGSFRVAFAPTGNYKLRVVAPRGLVFSYQPEGAVDGETNISVGPGKPSITVFGLIEKGSEVSGQVNNDLNLDKTPDGDQPMAGVTVELYDMALTVQLRPTNSVATDDKGIFKFEDVPPGGYKIKVVIGPGMTVSYQPNGGVDGQHEFSMRNGDPVSDLIFGLKPLGASVSGTVYLDVNRDQDPNGDPPAPNVVVKLQDTQGNEIATATTGQDGKYDFSLVPVGDYVVVMIPPDGYEVSYGPDGSFNGRSSINVQPNESVVADFGIKVVGASVSGRVLRDANFDGLAEGDQPLAGVAVTILTADGRMLAKNTSDFDGTFVFPDVPAGNYVMKLVPTGGMAYSYGPPGAANASWTFTMKAGESVTDIVFGFKPSTHEITGTVLVDANRDGAAKGDPPAQGVQVHLMDVADKVLATVSTDSNGTFVFGDVPAGQFVIKVDAPGTGFAYEPKGSKDGVYPITSQPGVPIEAVFGLVPPSIAVVSGRVLLDKEPFFSRDGDTIGVANVTVTLWNANAVVVGETVTDSSGGFKFVGLATGNYSVLATPPQGYEITYDTSRTVQGTSVVTVTNEIAAEVFIGIQMSTGGVTGRIQLDGNRDRLPHGDPALPDVKVMLVDPTGSVVGKTVSDSNGNFAFPELVVGQYTLKVDLSPGRVVIYGPDGGRPDGSFPITVTTGPPHEYIIGLSPPICPISGTILSDENLNGGANGDPPVPNVLVHLALPNGTVLMERTTNADGIFTFDTVVEGQYVVKVFTVDDRPFSYEPHDCTDGICRVYVVAGERTHLVFGLRPPWETVCGQITRFMHGEMNVDSPLEDIDVLLVDTQGNVVQTATTNKEGNYTFARVSYGEYRERINLPPELEVGFEPDGTFDGHIEFAVAPKTPANFDFALRERTVGSITAMVVSDDEGRGKATADSTPVKGVMVSIYKGGNSVPVDFLDTDETGKATFSKLAKGTYRVAITTMPGQSFAFDDDTTNDGSTEVQVEASEPSLATFGVRRVSNSTIIVCLEEDVKRRGAHVPNSPGVGGVHVTLQDASGVAVLNGTTAANGEVKFTQIAGGNYTVTVELPRAYVFSYGTSESTNGHTQLKVAINGQAKAVFGLLSTGTVCQERICNLNATCRGGRSCVCNDGFHGDGVTCEDEDECLDLSRCRQRNSVCSNSDGSFSCGCEPGYSNVGGVCRPNQCLKLGYGDQSKCVGTVERVYELGAVLASTEWTQITFSSPFPVPPVVFAGPAGMAEEDFVDAVVSNVTASGFKIRLQEPLCLDLLHLKEQVAWFAVVPEKPTDFGGSKMFAVRSDATVGSNQTVKFSGLSRAPAILGEVQDMQDNELIAVQPVKGSRDSAVVAVVGSDGEKNRKAVTIGVLAIEPNVGAVSLFGGPAVRFAASKAEEIRSDFSTVKYSMAGFQAAKPPAILASVWARSRPVYAYARVSKRGSEGVSIREEMPNCKTKKVETVTDGKVSIVALRPEA